MNTLTKRKRARLALQLLGSHPEPEGGTFGLVWVRFDSSEIDGRVSATVTRRIGGNTYADQRFMVDLEDIALVTSERP